MCDLHANALLFLGAHFVWAFGRSVWQYSDISSVSPCRCAQHCGDLARYRGYPAGQRCQGGGGLSQQQGSGAAATLEIVQDGTRPIASSVCVCLAACKQTWTSVYVHALPALFSGYPSAYNLFECNNPAHLCRIYRLGSVGGRIARSRTSCSPVAVLFWVADAPVKKNGHYYSLLIN